MTTNYIPSNLGITVDGSVDQVNQSKHLKPQALLFTVNPSNVTVSINNANSSDIGINQSTRRGFLTGRRPLIGQQYPRGVYNK